jgi:serine/threonine protein kinase
MTDMSAGLSVGSYRLINLIGQTGMSEVWRAADGEGKIVALKTISSQAGKDPQLRSRFLREGGEHRELSHPAIVPILDFFEYDDSFYLVMQFLSGGSLEDQLERNGWGPLPIPVALRISGQILPALDYAHQRLIIHRDVKPSNILLDGDRAFLADFGIALALGRPRLTTYAQILGTRCYMSPEQIQTPMEITHLTDVYSFGCVLYEMLTGRQPHNREETSELEQYAMLAKRVHEPPIPPREWNPGISLRLERIVLTSLAPEPQDRFSGCGSFARALEGLELERAPAKVVVPPLPPSPPFAPSAPLPTSPQPPPMQAVPDSPVVRPIIAAPAPAQVQRVSAGGNAITAFLMGALWLPFSGQRAEDLGVIIVLCALASHVLFLRMLYKAWEMLPIELARTTPGKAVGYLFIPFYNLYWCWKVLPGLASDYSRYLRETGSQEQPGWGDFSKLFCLLYFYLPVVAVASLVPAFSRSVLLFNAMVMSPIMIGVLAAAINRLPAVAQQQLAKPVSNSGQAIR